MVGFILDQAIERQGRAIGKRGYSNHYALDIEKDKLLMDQQHSAPALDFLEIRKDIDKNLRQEFSKTDKWKKMRGNQDIYMLVGEKKDPLAKALRACFSITDEPKGLSIVDDAEKRVIIRGGGAIRDLNKLIGTDIPVQAKEKEERQR